MKKKVISFSLYGDNPKYLQGSISNCELAKKVFPDWICRFYYEPKLHDSETIKQLQTFSNAETILISTILPPDVVKVGEASGMLWRLLVMVDPDVEMFMSRDVDSRLNWREKVCVEEWIKSEKSYFSIREHGYMPRIMVGMFGGKTNLIPNLKQQMISYVRNGYPKFGIKPSHTAKRMGDEKFCKICIYATINSNDVICFSATPIKKVKECCCCLAPKKQKAICRLIKSEVSVPLHPPLEPGMGYFVGQDLDENAKPVLKPTFISGVLKKFPHLMQAMQAYLDENKIII